MNFVKKIKIADATLFSMNACTCIMKMHGVLEM